MTQVDPGIIAAWIDADPDPATRDELRALDPELLAERFAAPLTFGTAGIRGPVRAGPNGMNIAVVTRTTAGIAAWLQGRCLGGSTVVVGRDTRRGSESFARAAAEVMAGACFRVVLLPRPLPTPLVAYATRKLGAAAGIQITASHNPPEDNGYKLYLDGGAQLVAPADREIEKLIAAAPGATSVPRQPVEASGDEIVTSYLHRVATLPRTPQRNIRVALTAMHGVGGETAVAALRGAGFTDIHLVREQFEPDPAFPTVRFPNPEEPGASDLLLSLAAEVEADIAVALDPDADRCAIGVPAPGGWRMLSGDETGVLLGDHVLRHTTGDRLVATTIVSSSMLGKIAAAYGARYAETLTGFKWLVRAGSGLVYAYEEAIGICADPHTVLDKDGISAAVVACDLAASLKSANSTLLDALSTLMDEHGVHITAQVSRRFASLHGIADAMARLRGAMPAEIGGEQIEVTDMLTLRGQRRTDAVVLRGRHLRIVVRPSGTEPKLKCYLEAAMDDNSPGSRAAASKLIDAGRTFAASL
ncbi:phospho-sugar mutase [Hoyosella altamirensis]|uniref:Phosphomannomutase n=1 Tax=Hoyosella altamirensis TaxID=616997 RepID=A0A839RG49_9ACTN|nr:phospho-sugar mutase [Hoyosella altamirensis]MBB3035575.1 phosphomannomutase [Hoyosella altamirensis]